MLDASIPSLLDEQRPSRLGSLLGRVLQLAYRIAGRHRYDDYRLERVKDMQLLVIPTVANPKLLRTGAFFASVIESTSKVTDGTVLDLGTGSGICALFAARRAQRVVAVDINPAAVRCARVNATINHLDSKIDVRQGDLLEPVTGARFDVVLFNPPFIVGEPRDFRDAAWRSTDVPQRFARALKSHLNPGGFALLLLSSFGNAGPLFESELRARHFKLEVFARRRYVNETLTVLRVEPGSEDELRE